MAVLGFGPDMRVGPDERGELPSGLMARGAVRCSRERLLAVVGTREAGARSFADLWTPGGPVRMRWSDDGGEQLTVELDTLDDGPTPWMAQLMTKGTEVLGTVASGGGFWDASLATYARAYADFLRLRSRVKSLPFETGNQLNWMAIEIGDMVLAHERPTGTISRPSNSAPEDERWWGTRRWLMGDVVCSSGSLRVCMAKCVAYRVELRGDLEAINPGLDFPLYDCHSRTLAGLVASSIPGPDALAGA
jgi:hypothetical protein